MKRELRDFLKGSVLEGREALMVNNCERRRCRDALVSPGLRLEFARRFGPAFERHVDIVACNFPAWQCALFMHVNVTVVMRFTHRWDHHLQGHYADPGNMMRPAESWSELQRPTSVSSSHQEGLRPFVPPSAALNASKAASLRWRRVKGKSGGAEILRREGLLHQLPAVALKTLQAMAAQPNVVLAASNAYDAMYLKQAFDGLDALPWPGTARQLASVAYTGDRREPLFCCGNVPYNHAIRHVAQLISNASLASAAAVASAPHDSVGAPTFLWPSQIGARRGGYRYTDLAAHPLAVILPYSVHSYGVVQAYAMGVPLVAPSPRLLGEWHRAFGLMGFTDMNRPRGLMVCMHSCVSSG